MTQKPVPPKQCPYCRLFIKNKDYMNHLAEEHDDNVAKQILKELERL